eukprot:TRINITY_DN1295_c0_g1_i2.p1 TRINITY_DN1295_c0_g1~~TRINITY_DN1295_c0_g1_i2.p1  ORF type:complete len:156 (-),score=41.70 TRINITY_DN1295_c0_g1_i2:169-636(-)
MLKIKLFILRKLSLCFFFFFFQAEDGIRDAQESRGLGDVYKRQVYTVEVLEGILAMLGQSAHGWDQLQSTVLRHPDQLKQAMHLLAHMVACSEAPTQNFEAVAETVGLWEEGGMVEKAATESSVAAVICEWGIGLYAYHQASLANPNQGSLGTGY